MEHLSTLKRLRGVQKGKITIFLQNLKRCIPGHRPSVIASIKSSLSRVVELNADIEKAFMELPAAVSDDYSLSEAFSAELDGTVDYSAQIESELAKYTGPIMSDPQVDRSQPVAFDLKLPHMNCDSFSGEDKDVLKFTEFLNKFNNLIGHRTTLSDSVKLTYLKSYLTGYASKVIDYLPISDSNYEEALNILKAEFLNVPEVVNSLFQKLLSAQIKPDKQFRSTKIFLNDMRSILHDLKSHDRDLLGHPPTAEFIGSLLFNKLPDQFRIELVRKLDNNYPKYDDIMNNYREIINTLNLRPKFEPNKEKLSKSVVNLSNTSTDSSDKIEKAEPKFSNSIKCKFCSLSNHRMLSCFKYATHAARVKRCKELKLCSHCTSSKHDSTACNKSLDFECLICKSKSHISALCSKYDDSSFKTKKKTEIHLCLNSTNDSSSSTHLLPTLSVTVGRGKSSVSVRCLLDTGSQRSYLAREVLDRLGCARSEDSVSYTVQSFLETGSRSFSEYSLSLDLSDGQGPFNMPILIDNEFDLTYEVEFLTQALENLRQNYKLADDSLGSNSNSIRIDGILGTDVLQYFSKLELVNCMQGQAFKVNSGLIPFGSIELFLTNEQNRKNYECLNANSNLNQLVNFVTNPVAAYSDSIGDVITDSQIEGNLEKFFSVESLGLVDDENETSKFDQNTISKFKNNVEFKDGQYFVDLVWDEEVLEEVDDNFYIAKAVLSRVVTKLNDLNLYDDYEAVFKQQLEEGILEKVSLENLNSKIFIPHRPVVKVDQQCTTKVRPVLNCSVKSKNKPSLNQAAYPGINLLQNLFDILVRVRLNEYLVTSDIRQAFLQIKLKSEFDRNKFCILWQDATGQLIAYRYTALPFGFVSSPFVLNFLIQHHASQFEDDEVTYALKNNFYVDNLFFTSDSQDDLFKFYTESKTRMMQGGFLLRTWQSNSDDLKEVLISDGSYVEHDQNWEKLLGYKYYPDSDEISISEIPNEYVSTKRGVLSFSAKLFDPLGLYGPIVNSSKLIMRELWEQKAEWDAPLTESHEKEFGKFVQNVNHIENVKFRRSIGSASGENPELVVFCDASKLIYGFCVYLVNPNDTDPSRLVFSKSKVAPLKTKTLPTLELMAIYLAYKCLVAILQSLRKLNISKVTIASDSQVALSWVMDQKIKNKNVFAANRLKDISSIRDKIFEQFNVPIVHEYINTKLNPADLLTRSLNFTAFDSNLDLWKHGPKFLQQNQIVWPHSDLMSISPDNKALMCNSAVLNSAPSSNSFVNELVGKYSTLHKLIRVVTFVLMFVSKLRGVKCSFSENFRKSKLFLIKCDQANSFPEEIGYLRNKKGQLPTLINNLNLFMDDEGVLRSTGRLGQSSSISFQINNPIVLPSNSCFTELIIRNAHVNCNHLSTNSTLDNLRRDGFWILKGRTAVNKVLKNCYMCKRYNSRPLKYPNPPDLPKDRVNYVKPFNVTGIDFTGHFYVKLGSTVTKMYLLLMTCMTIRAVHIELVPDMSTRSFLLSFLHFCNIFSIPETVFSDNCNTFLNGLMLLNSTHLDNEWNNFLLSNNIVHKTIPRYSAWVGSSWERCIRTVKSCIYKTIGRRQLEFFEFRTLLGDICTSINSRPLTYRDDGRDFQVLTPNDFIKPGCQYAIQFGGLGGEELVVPSRKQLIDSLSLKEEILDNFKDRYYNEYLVSLREKSRDLYQNNWRNEIKPGDVVLINTPSNSRPYWTMARVEELVVGNDGIVRSVRVRKPNGDRANHSINHLYMLELALDEEEASPPPREDEIPSRPRRKAKDKCLQRLKNL